MQKKPWKILSLIFSLLLTSCQDKNPCNLPAETLEELDTLESLIRKPEIQKRHKEWMEGNYNEPSLFNAKSETYRFTLHSSFDGIELYRIEEKDGHYKATKKVFASYGDTTGVISEFELTKEAWDNIVNGLIAKNFWTYLYTPKKKTMYLDPTSWTLEGYKPIKDKCTLKNYHFISMQFPQDTTFISMCKLLSEIKEN